MPSCAVALCACAAALQGSWVSLWRWYATPLTETEPLQTCAASLCALTDALPASGRRAVPAARYRLCMQAHKEWGDASRFPPSCTGGPLYTAALLTPPQPPGPASRPQPCAFERPQHTPGGPSPVAGSPSECLQTPPRVNFWCRRRVAVSQTCVCFDLPGNVGGGEGRAE